LVSFILLTKDAITTFVFEESTGYLIIEEELDFDKAPLLQEVFFMYKPCAHFKLRPILFAHKTYYTESTCIELHSPPPEV